MASVETILDNILETLSASIKEKGFSYEVSDLKKILSEKTKPVSVARVSSTPVTISSDRTCIFEPSTGKNKNIRCNKPCHEGYDYCRSCLNRETVKRKLGFPMRANSKTKEKPATTTKITVDREYKLGLEPIESIPGHYYMPNCHYIVEKQPNETYVAVGVGEHKIERPLNKEEKEDALEKGLRVLDN